MLPSALFRTAGRIWNNRQHRTDMGNIVCHSIGDGTSLVFFAYDVNIRNA